MINVTRAMGGVYVVSMSSETENAVIRYTTDGNEPGETSPVYTEPLELAPGVTVKARAYEDVYHEPSDLYSVTFPNELTPTENIPIGTTLYDGSIIFYDRGAEYGDYSLFADNLFKLSDSIDDGSYNSDNWRFLISWNPQKLVYCNKPVNISGDFNIRDSNIGYGYQNTVNAITAYGKNTSLMWYDIKQFRETNGSEWFVPTYREAKELNSIIDRLPEGKGYFMVFGQPGNNAIFRFRKVSGNAELTFYSDRNAMGDADFYPTRRI